MNDLLIDNQSLIEEINAIKFDRPVINLENVISQVARYLMEYQALHIDKLKSYCYAIFLSHTEYSMNNPYKKDKSHEELEHFFYEALVILKKNIVLQGITKNGWVYQTNSIGTKYKPQMNHDELHTYIFSS